MNRERKIKVYGRYFMDFYQSLEEGAKNKIDYVLDMLKTQEKVHIKFVKHIRDGVYEIRAEYSGNISGILYLR